MLRSQLSQAFGWGKTLAEDLRIPSIIGSFLFGKRHIHRQKTENCPANRSSFESHWEQHMCLCIGTVV